MSRHQDEDESSQDEDESSQDEDESSQDEVMIISYPPLDSGGGAAVPVKTLHVGPGSPGPGDEWHIPDGAPIPHREDPESGLRSPKRAERVLKAQGNPVTLDVMPDSSHEALLGKGWPVFLAAFDKASGR